MTYTDSDLIERPELLLKMFKSLLHFYKIETEEVDVLLSVPYTGVTTEAIDVEVLVEHLPEAQLFMLRTIPNSTIRPSLAADIDEAAA